MTKIGSEGKGMKSFGKKDVLITLLFEVLVPYIRDKLDSKLTQLKTKNESDLSRKEKFFLRFYKYFDMFVEVV
jgi:lipopolysaccharide export LptBFGC system permease protein LptF